MNVKTMSPTTPPLWERNCLHISASAERVGVAALAGGAVAMVASVITDPRVKNAVKYVGDEVEEHDQHGEDEGQRLHERNIRTLHGSDQQLAEPVHTEDLLGDD